MVYFELEQEYNPALVIPFHLPGEIKYMKVSKSFRFVLFVLVLVLASVACEFSASTANIANAHMSVDEADSQQTTSYSPDAPAFYCYFDLKNAPDDTIVKGTWTLISAEGYDPNQEIDSAEITGGDDTYYFSLGGGEGLWPVGQYKIDLYLNEELVQTVNFSVQ